MQKTKPWYIGGLHFECQKCGRCCSGPEEGVILISKPEIDMLAEHLGLSPAELRKKHLKRAGLRYSIQEEPRSKDCVFLVKFNSSKGCAVYNFRPMQCRNWPFWPMNLSSPDDWNAAAVKCPGINKGKLYTFDEIQKVKNQKQWWNCLAPTPAVGVQSRDGNGAVLLKICDEVKKIYDWLDSIIKPLNYQCDACGKCCDFDSFGHKLFITSPEYLYFKQNVKNILPMSENHCPYLRDNKCTARDFRFAGCRIFFCKGDKDVQNKLSEKTVDKFKRLCDKLDIPYYYKDLAAILENRA